MTTPSEARANAARDAMADLRSGRARFLREVREVVRCIRVLNDSVVYALEVGESGEEEAMREVGTALYALVYALSTQAECASEWGLGILRGYAGEPTP